MCCTVVCDPKADFQAAAFELCKYIRSSGTTSTGHAGHQLKVVPACPLGSSPRNQGSRQVHKLPSGRHLRVGRRQSESSEMAATARVRDLSTPREGPTSVKPGACPSAQSSRTGWRGSGSMPRTGSGIVPVGPRNVTPTGHESGGPGQQWERWGHQKV